jgi:predicted nucleic acid-binding Zn ribbon protein
MPKVLGRLGAPPSLDTMEIIFTRWPEVVGAELAAHLQPVRVSGTVLVVAADHPAWVTRGRMDAERIIASAQALGDATIERIEIVLQRP